MKYTIILGFIATISAVSAILSDNSGVQRVLYPREWANAVDICSADVTEATVDSFMSYGEPSVTAAVKCYTLCVYTEAGVFVEDEFDPTALEIFWREYIGCHYLLERTIAMFKAAANAGNAKQGSNSEKTWVYHTTFATPEHQKLWKAVFRPIGNSWSK